MAVNFEGGVNEHGSDLAGEPHRRAHSLASVPLRAACVAAIIAIGFGQRSTLAASYYWDANGTAAGAGATPSGTWGTSNFLNTDSTGGSGGAFATTSTGSDTIQFVAAPDTTASGINAYAVGVNGTQSTLGLTFLSVGAITLGSSSTTINLGTGGISVPNTNITGGTSNNASNPTINSNIALQGNQTFSVARASAGLTVNGAISGSGNLTLSGNFNRQFNNANSYVGTTTLSNSGVTILGGSNGSLGTGDVIFNDTFATLQFAQTADTIFSNNITGSGPSSAVQKVGSATLTLSGTNTFTGGTLIRLGALKVSSIATNLGGTTLIRLGTSTDTGTLIYAGSGETSSKEFSLAGTSGGGNIESDGNGALVLTGTLITNVSDTAKTFGLQGSNTGNNEFRNVIANSTTKLIGVTKSGAGKWILSGVNTYTGATNISGGTLIVGSAGVGSIAGSAVTVTSGTLGGTGSIGGAVSVTDTIAAGDGGAGTLTIANTLTLGSASHSNFELGGTATSAYDRIAGLTGLTLDGTITVSDISGFNPARNNTFNLFNWSGTVTSSSFNVSTDLVLPSLAVGLTWDKSTFLTTGSITVIPEPEGIVLLFAAVPLLARRRRCDEKSR